MPDILLFSPFPPGEPDLLCIDHNDVVTAIHMRGKICFVLAPDHAGYLRTEPAQYLVCGIHDIPILLNCGIVRGDRFVTQCIHFMTLLMFLSVLYALYP